MDFLKNFSEVALGFVVELLKLMPIMIFVFGFKLQPVKRIVFFWIVRNYSFDFIGKL